MKNIIGKLLVIAALSVSFSSKVFALDENCGEAYTGNFNGGTQDTIYHMGSKIILIPVGDIDTPIKICETDYSFAIVDGDDPALVDEYKTSYLVDDLGMDDLRNNFYKLHIGDFNGDNRSDLFFQSKEPTRKHYILFATNKGNFKKYQVYNDQTEQNDTFNPEIFSWNDGYMGVQWSTVNINIVNQDGDSLAEIQAITGGTGSGYVSPNVGIYYNNTSSRSLEYNSGQNSLVEMSAPSIGGSLTLNYNKADMVVGNTSGAFAVDPSGGANYSIPLVVPPGVGDMQPTLSLNFMNQGMSGPVGIGGGIGGLSNITRCPQTYAQDGNLHGIHFDNDDRLCLDGQRLVVVNGTYGVIGSEYRTESDVFSRITQYGGDLTSSSTWFKVETKAGQTYYYGADNASGSNSRTSRVAIGSSIISWSTGRIDDAVGNQIRFKYAGAGDNSHRIESIEYTSVTGGNASVGFIFESRPDASIAYLEGKRMVHNMRLSQVVSRVNGNQIRAYKLLYEISPSTKRSRIRYILECGEDDMCKQPIQFSWNDENSTLPKADSFSNILTKINPVTGQELDRGYCANFDYGGPETSDFVDCRDHGDRNRILTGDIDGDGFSDMCYRNASGFKCVFGTKTGFGDYVDTGICVADCTRETLRLIDVNGDGYADFIYRNPTNGITVYFSNGSARTFTGVASGKFTHAVESQFAWDNNPDTSYWGFDLMGEARMFYPDINGDGRLDMCLLPRWVQYFYTGDNNEYIDKYPSTLCYINQNVGKTFTAFTPANPDFVCGEDCDRDSVETTDINGDAKADLIFRTNSTGIIYKLSTGSSGFEAATTTGICAAGSNYFGICDSNNIDTINYADVTGDGIADLCMRADIGITCVPGTGSGFDTNHAITSKICGDNIESCTHLSTLQFIDLNGDGKADISFLKDWEGIKTYLSTESGFVYNDTHEACGKVPGPPYSCNDAIDNYGTIQYADINGDGDLDLVFRGDNGVHPILSNANIRPDMLASIKDGLGNTTTLQYQRMTDGMVYDIQSEQYEKLYTRCTTSYPETCLNVPMYLLSSYKASNGVSGTAEYRLRYHNLKLHLRGRGMLGFSSVESMDVTNDKKVTTYFNTSSASTGVDGYANLYPYLGMPNSAETWVAGVIVSTITNTFTRNRTNSENMPVPYFPYFESSTENKYEYPSRTWVSSIETQNFYDENQNWKRGNLSRTIVTSRGADHQFTKTVVNSYNEDDWTQWHLGRLTRTEVEHSTTIKDKNGVGVPSINRTSTFGYNADGLLASSTEEPGRADMAITTSYGYNDYGNKETVTLHGDSTSYAVADRTTRSWYSDLDGNKTAVSSYITTYNAEGHKETKLLHSLYGSALELIGPNGLSTLWGYDNFGRKTSENRADGTSTTINYGWCNSSCDLISSYAEYYVTTTSTGSAPVTVYYDSLDREVGSRTEDINGSSIFIRKTYNSKGQLVSETLPFYAGDTPQMASEVLNFDGIGRVKKEKDASGTTMDYIYDGLNTTVKVENITSINLESTAAIRTTSKSTYVNGKSRMVSDTLGNVTSFYYDAVGNLKASVAPDSTTTMDYDLKGRKMAMNDPDMGVWSYEYDAFGQLRKQTDANNNAFTFEYDKLGRKILAVEPEGDNLWIYDTAPGKGIGKLHKVIGPVAMDAANQASFLAGPPTFDTTSLESAAPVVKILNYDNLGRASRQITQLDGTPYEMTSHYFNMGGPGDDPDYTNPALTGHLARILYPKRDHDNLRLGVSYSYATSIGGKVFLTKAERHDYSYDATADKWNQIIPDTPLSPIWELGYGGDYSAATNIRGQVIQESYGNGLITHREYDLATGRVKNIKTGTAGDPFAIQDVAYVFDSLGNLEQRTDNRLKGWSGQNNLVETFGYDALNRFKRVEVTGAPATVQQLTYSAGGNILTNSRLGSYVYDPVHTHAVKEVQDATGNVLAGHSYAYDANGNMINRGGNVLEYTSYNKPRNMNQSGQQVAIDYGPDHTRYKKTVNMSAVTYYLSPRYDSGTHFEKEIVQTIDGPVSKYVYHLYAGGQMIGIHKVESTGVRATRFFHTDHLDSVAVITNELGGVVERRSYSAFGEMQPVMENDNSTFSLTASFSSSWVATGENHHGYTGHEHLDQVGLIHMNGRVYDPVLARFLSADPNVQFPESSQGYNRYTYVNNNPLSFTDPSGYLLSGLRGEIRDNRQYIQMAIMMYVSYQTGVGIAGQGMIMAGVIGGGMSGYLLSRGDTKAAVRGALMGAAFAYVGSEISAYNACNLEQMAWYEEAFAHGVIGGISAGISGGNAKNGFIAAFVGKAITVGTRGKYFEDKVVLRGVIASIGGGISSKLGGGKFENGAYTAAMGYLFNETNTRFMRTTVTAFGATVSIDWPYSVAVEETGETGKFMSISFGGNAEGWGFSHVAVEETTNAISLEQYLGWTGSISASVGMLDTVAGGSMIFSNTYTGTEVFLGYGTSVIPLPIPLAAATANYTIKWTPPTDESMPISP